VGVSLNQSEDIYAISFLHGCFLIKKILLFQYSLIDSVFRDDKNVIVFLFDFNLLAAAVKYNLYTFY